MTSFFFQAEDGIRDADVTGVQTCALPISLSSASGNAPFDAALRRYVDILTADGALEVELEVDPGLALAPDEQIEVFRIVQEGLANVRQHAGALRAEVNIGRRGSERFVVVRDEGVGFNGNTDPAGQGIKKDRKSTRLNSITSASRM